MDYPKSVPGIGLVGGKFVDENTATGQQGSLIPSVWGNSVTDELLNLIRAAGVEPDEAVRDQIAKILWADPSEAKRGMPMAATQAEMNAGLSAQKMATPKGLSTVFGLGQAWQSPSRALGVSYTNTSTRPILVVVQCTVNAGISSTPLVFTLDGTHAFMSLQNSGNGNGCCVMVPPGSIYMVAGSSYTLNTWREYR